MVEFELSLSALLLVVVVRGEGKAMVVQFMGSQSALARGIVWLNVVAAALRQL